MEKKSEEKKERLWDALVVVKFKGHKLRLSILVLAIERSSAKEKAIEWTRKYIDKNRDSITKRVGNANPVGEPTVTVLKTGYMAIVAEGK